jgi:dTDP-4-amino-4,6-dideoxygalactose transaminase
MGQRFGGRLGQCPVTEYVSDRLLRLPFYNSITTDEQSSVVETILAFDCEELQGATSCAQTFV